MRVISIAILGLAANRRGAPIPVVDAQGLGVVSGSGISVVQSLPASIIQSIPTYDVSKCDAWLNAAKASDSDGSGGLDEGEYYAFLKELGTTSLPDDDGDVAAYFAARPTYLDLDWTFKITHKALSCQCKNLGMGNECCEGEDAEIPITEIMSADMSDTAAAFRADLCNSIAAVFDETIPEAEEAEAEEEDPPPPDDATTTAAATTAAAVTTVAETTAAAATDAAETTAAATAVAETTAAATTVAATTAAATVAETTAAAATTAADADGATTAADETTADETTVAATTAAEATTAASVITITGAETTTVAAATTPADDSVITITGAETTPAPADDRTGGTVIDIVGSTLDYSTFDYSTIFDGVNAGVPDFYNAAEVTANIGKNEVLSHVIKGFGNLSNELLGKLGGAAEQGKRRALRGTTTTGRELQNGAAASLKPVVVTDIPCPDGLEYAPKDTLCLNFKMVMDTPSLDDGQVNAFADGLRKAIDEEGRLYDIITKGYANTQLKGIGSPGKGVDYRNNKPSGANAATLNASEAEEEEEDGGGLSSGLIVLIVLVVMFVPIAILALYAQSKKRQDEERQERIATYEASRHSKNYAADIESGAAAAGRSAVPPLVEGSDDGSVWSESRDIGDIQASKAGSSLAAMGAAGLAASGVKKDLNDDETRAEIRRLCKETNSPKPADELLQAYAGREKDLLINLRKLHAKQTKDADVRAEVEKLAKETNAPKSADEMLASYKGREEELLKNLRKMRANQRTHEEKQKIRAEVETLVKETGAPKSVDELLSTYEGREDELIKNLKKMKAKTERDAGVVAEVRTLCEETNAPKSADEMLASYAGREEDLLKNLKKMKAKQEAEALRNGDKAAVRAEVEILAQETGAPKSVDELMASYAGREDELLKNLKKMKEKQGKDAELRAEVAQLASETNAPKSADEMLASYKGREDELLKNLRKMKEKQQAETGQQEQEVENAKDAEIRAEVEQLVAYTGAPKTADEMLASYKGREDELLKNLRKMKKKKDKQENKQASEAKAAVVAEVTSLVEATNPGKSPEEMLAAYDGKEEELLKNLRKMKAKQEKAAAKKAASERSVTTEEPAAPAPAASAGGADRAAIQDEVAELVALTNPGKNAEELLTAYEGREQELITHLKKLKTSKRNL
eukprot:CAMPEP_0181130878 /NCGR_PEP_ID=MMETSP1071-20121207/30107_1 /TAXON_ID=35127 /ORGANISM="Thalassiosira sp., Strain NH16" /LENGTH=1153 /DNA_ID=CAMNT_0023216995 /DNA_START=242 /DNA_END=3703 /DNA_ORIENTATION=-